MKVGFTGTREGMTAAQIREVHYLLSELDPAEFHHGDCVGADKQFHHAALILAGPLRLRAERPRVIVHPPMDERYRAFCEPDEFRPRKPYLQRNHDIVDETDVLIAAPATATAPASLQGQGTWSTVFYALRKHKTVYLVAPDGSVSTPTAAALTAKGDGR